MNTTALATLETLYEVEHGGSHLFLRYAFKREETIP